MWVMVRIEGLPTGEISSGGFMDEILRSFGVVEMPRTARGPILARNIERVDVLGKAVQAGGSARALPFAMVTPEPDPREGVERRWHSSEPVGRMRWRGGPNWSTTVGEIYSRYPDHLAVCLECHL